MFRSIRSVIFFVDDVLQSVEWYKKLLGVEPVVREGRLSHFEIGGTVLYLHPADDRSPVSTGNQIVYWEVDFFGSAVGKATEMGATIHRGPKELKGGVMVCQLKDPYGNVFGIQGRSMA